MRSGVLARLELALPDTSALASEDVRWLVRELNRRTPLNLFEEVRQLNLEALRTWLDAQPRRAAEKPAA
jgi:hypothetical protein